MDSGPEEILILEPFYGGSHKKLIDVITSNLPSHQYKLITMTAKKWHWRARTSALYMSTQIPVYHKFKILLCTSVLPLAELLGLRPDLTKLHKIVYFHENQLEFPVRVVKDRDFQYGYNEILTCLTADKVLFNSYYNKDSFLSHIKSHLKLQPDYKVKNLEQIIEGKCYVVYYPMDISLMDKYLSLVDKTTSNTLHIVWPHRWEFDKNPEAFYRVLKRLDNNGYHFKVSILGESFNEKPDVFRELSRSLKESLLHCGYVESLREYYKILNNADVVVSTAIHEFFGVAVLEAVYCGCIPVVPKRLSYRELYLEQVEEVYDTENELYNILGDLCTRKEKGELNKDYRHIALQFESNKWFSEFVKLLSVN
ncbi:glycosyltransferase-like domain-containing protein 1 [Galleria mellonella]|uniref:tRNA-queuosine alpha-mannosyltransferase n=1 Tax=Galleria mellonella TaxID=7137 RepID=A0A6J1X6P6_GALME|nr:glycosyltransferase-like domain-containing protein 1 [Galleria mellonella]